MTATEDQDLWTFDRFAPGHDFGIVPVELDRTRRAAWEDIYGTSQGDRAPKGMLVAAMMEAYIRAIQPRPKGNVHAGQSLSFTQAAADFGDRVDFAVRIGAKELRNGRRWVTFAVVARVGDRRLLTGEIRSIWAA